MMNYLLGTDKVAGKRAGLHSCLYCNKVFNNHRALGGHLRAHQEEIRSRRTWNYPDHSSNSIDISCTNPNFLPSNCPENSSGGAGNNLTLYHRAISPSDFSRRFCSNETSWMNASTLSENNLGTARPPFIVPPNLSSGSGSSEIYHSNCLSSTAFAASGSNAATGFPLDPSLCSGTNGVCQFNTDEFRTCRDGMPLSSGEASQNFQGHNPSKLPYPAFAVTDPNPGLGSNPLPGFKESATTGSSSLCPGPCSGKDEVGQHDKVSVLTREGGKRPYFGSVQETADMMNAPKRPKIMSNPPVETLMPQKKELPLFMDVEKSFSGSGIPFDDKEEPQADVDLSLHL